MYDNYADASDSQISKTFRKKKTFLALTDSNLAHSEKLGYSSPENEVHLLKLQKISNVSSTYEFVI